MGWVVIITISSSGSLVLCFSNELGSLAEQLAYINLVYGQSLADWMAPDTQLWVLLSVIHGISVTCAVLDGMSSTCADLEGMSSTCADLDGMSSTCADLDGISVTCADLDGMSSTCADLDGMSLTCADLDLVFHLPTHNVKLDWKSYCCRKNHPDYSFHCHNALPLYI